MPSINALELALQAEIIGVSAKTAAGLSKTRRSPVQPSGLLGQDFWADKTSERFKAGKPDLRVSRLDLGQCDFELKYVREQIDDLDQLFEPGFTKLQWLKLREMNAHGIPAAGLVYVECRDEFVLCNLLRASLRQCYPCGPKLPKPLIIDGEKLIKAARVYLRDKPY